MNLSIQLMNRSLLQLSRGLIGVGLIVISSYAAAQSSEQEEAALYEYLFPEESTAATDEQPEVQTKRFSGFEDENRRSSWSEEQIREMRENFKNERETKVPPRSNQIEIAPDDQSVFRLQPEELEDSPYSDLVAKYAKKYGVNASVVHEIIKAESAYDPNAVSPKGAKGLMQLMDDLSERFSINPFDPESNIKVGVQYFAEMLARFKKLELALAAYNAGPGAVEKYKGIPPYPETQNYVSKILAGIGNMEVRFP